MLIETSQMQRLIVVLGHPTYGLSVVLFSLLLSSGLGSCSDQPDRAGRDRGRRAWSAWPCSSALLVVFGVVTPLLAHRFEGATTPVRIAVSAALLCVPGLFMGMAFPLGMRLAPEPRRP